MLQKSSRTRRKRGLDVTKVEEANWAFVCSLLSSSPSWSGKLKWQQRPNPKFKESQKHQGQTMRKYWVGRRASKGGLIHWIMRLQSTERPKWQGLSTSLKTHSRTRISRNELELEAAKFLLIQGKERLHLRVVLAMVLFPWLLEDLDQNLEAEELFVFLAHCHQACRIDC